MSLRSPVRPRSSYDVVIVGGGAAGLYTALSLPRSLNVGLITKDRLSFSASDWAQGGIAAAYRDSDSPVLHAEDTLLAGAGLCEVAAVEFLAQQAPAQVDRLLEMGIAFDRGPDQQLALTLEAAHSRPRVLHAADATGRALIQTLMAQVNMRANIEVLTDTFTLRLWLEPDSSRCQGVCLLSQGHIQWVKAAAVILATGGGGQVFAQTTNPELSTGDGLAMAWRAGAQVRDLEFVQFHPTALTLPGAPRFLISEAVRGEGAHLLDGNEHRFMFDYDPRGELAPRDIVSRSIFKHLQSDVGWNCADGAAVSGLDHVWLDFQPIPPAQIQRRFPKIIRVCQRWGVDVSADRVPVAPAAHYWMGGIVTDLGAQTSIPGLYAVGEVASTGVHGANRLASNSLLECLVFGAQFMDLAAMSRPIPIPDKQSAGSLMVTDWAAQQQIIGEIRQMLPRLVWDSAGICRDGPTMVGAIEHVQSWRQQMADLPISEMLLNLEPGQAKVVQLAGGNPDACIRRWAEVHNLLDVALLILKSALFRTESRGGHYRSDFPEVDERWQVHTLVEHHTWQTAGLGI